MDEIQWVIIESNTRRKIGAVGFLKRKAVVVVAFYDDDDADYDGVVTWGEWFASFGWPTKNTKLTEVAVSAKTDPEVLKRDPSFKDQADDMFFEFVQGQLAEGLYNAYFSRCVGGLAEGIADRITSEVVKSFVIRTGAEEAIKALYDWSVGP